VFVPVRLVGGVWTVQRRNARLVITEKTVKIAVMTVLERKLVSGAWRMGTTVKRLIWNMTALLPVDIAMTAVKLPQRHLQL